MARLERPTQKSENPTKRFLKWKSNDKCFSYYDKENAKNVDVALPFKFLFLEHYHTVKGWNDASESSIYSNEVYAIGSTELTVKAFKGSSPIAVGLYKENKTKIVEAGGKYHRSIYVMNEDGEIINISLKGAAVRSYSDFYSDNNQLLDNQWIEVNDATDGKKGSIKYSTPNFTIGGAIGKDANALADTAVSSLQNYMDVYTGKTVVKDEITEDQVAVEVEDNDEIPF
tara:strand:- start:5308 stop:5991 length:684 start_codon:yes stop_codon:yes gene_type:complete